MNELNNDNLLMQAGQVIVEKLDLEGAAQNSVIILRMEDLNANLIQSLAKMVERYGDLFKRKNITVMLLRAGDSISLADEKLMNDQGWFRREEKRIITPDRF